METSIMFDENAALKEIQKDFNKLVKSLEKISKIKASDSEALDELDKAIKGAPTGQTLSSAFDDLKVRAIEFLEEARKHREKGFRRIETDFIKLTKEKGKTVRESSGGWRIGVLELQSNPELSKVRFLYNREVIIPWQSVSSVEDFINAENNTLAMLDKIALSEENLATIFVEAYQQALARLANKTGSNIVPIFGLYKETRVALVRQFFMGKAPNAKLDQFTDFPRWAFLYNLDRYRTYSSTLPVQKRLGLQTGSQQEVSQGKGMIVNGLDPLQDYKVMCYVINHGIK